MLILQNQFYLWDGISSKVFFRPWNYCARNASFIHTKIKSCITNPITNTSYHLDFLMQFVSLWKKVVWNPRFPIFLPYCISSPCEYSTCDTSWVHTKCLISGNNTNAKTPKGCSYMRDIWKGPLSCHSSYLKQFGQILFPHSDDAICCNLTRPL